MGEITLEQSEDTAGWSGVDVCVNNVNTALFIGHADYADWLESKIDKIKAKPYFSELRTWKYVVDAVLTKEHGIGNYLDAGLTKTIAEQLQERFGNIPQQGKKCDEQTIAKAERKNLALSLMDYLDDNRVEGCMDLSSMECEDLENAVVNSDWGRLFA